MEIKRILITGSSGYVASDLFSHLDGNDSVLGIDKISSKHSHINAGIESTIFKDYLDQLKGEELIVINLAAARFDFGASAMDYYNQNIKCHQILISNFLTS